MIDDFLKNNGIDCLLVNSTNEFLVEYNSLEENSRYHLTGFSGSTGDALITPDGIFLFVDGRYHIQADNEVDHSKITVVKLQTGQTFLEEIVKKVPNGAVVGIVAKKNSQYRVEQFEKYFNVKLIDDDPFGKNSNRPKYVNEKIDLLYTGMTSDEKIWLLQEKLQQDEAFLFTNLEEVSYLFNMRDFSKSYAANILGKAFVSKNTACLYTPENMPELDEVLKNFKGRIFVDKSSVNARDFALINDRAQVAASPLKQMKSIKTEAEINHYKEAFKRTDAAMFAIRDYIENNDNISEYEIAERLEKEFLRFGARSLSFKSIVAKDKNSALAHYSKSSKDEIIKDGSLVLIDCGAYYEGGLATDITRVFVKGQPSELQKKVYTTVLKAFLHAFNFDRDEFCGYEVDALAREIFENNPIDGFEFNHGLGHGIGISVHEAPPNLSKNEIAKVKIEENMCFTIEPGLYNKEHFGVRLENSCYFQNGKINSFVNMCYENKLIDYDLLTVQEMEWLGKFEVR